MPRLFGPCRALDNFNHYDALFYGVEAARKLPSWFMLFGNANIGNAELTNTIIPSQNSGDATEVIQSWYARTNIPASAERDVFANQVMVTLIVGSRRMREMSLYDLLRRDEMSPMPRAPTAIQDEIDELAEIERVAEDLCYRFESHPAARSLPLSRVPDEIRKRWLDIARAARPASRPTMRPVVIPVRQNREVRVDTFGDPENRALMGAIRPWTDGGLCGMPGIWIHLSGVESRDVC